MTCRRRSGDLAWVDRAACKPHPRDWWLPTKGDEKSSARAVRICVGSPYFGIAPCPVRRHCAEFGRDTADRDSIMGGFRMWNGCDRRLLALYLTATSEQQGAA